jgi:alpha-1,2-mannosyltransferase
MTGFKSRWWATLALVVALGGSLLATSFRRGWTQLVTDFPNYYTAAALTLDRQPLRNFYEWTWFQRQMNYAGIDGLGGYIPHTPLTMLPMIPLARLPVQDAKRVWLCLGILFLAASVELLARMARFGRLDIWLVVLLAYGSLQTNLAYGQYYLFLLLLFTLAAWCLFRDRPYAAGAILGVVFAVKLYAAPFLLFFALKRQWKAVAGMALSMIAFSALAIAMFGIGDVWFYVHTVMARGLDGTTNDPYNPGWGSMAAFLRHALVAEPELNPHPLANAPLAFFFLKDVYTLGVLALACLVIARADWDRLSEFGWILMVLCVLSPATVSYHFILLAPAIVFFLRGAQPGWAAGLLTLYALIALPLSWYQHLLRGWYANAFPKAWLLLALMLWAAWDRLRVDRRWAALAAIGVVAISAIHASGRFRAYRQESTRVAEAVASQPDAVFASSPSIGPHRLGFETWSGARYAIRIVEDGQARTLAFEGHAFHPAIAAADVYFEGAAHGHSQIWLRDETGRDRVVAGAELEPREPAISADGRLLAFVSGDSLYLRENAGIRVIYRAAGIAQPAFFPAADRIAFVQGPPGARFVQSISILSGAADRLTPLDCFQPAVSPDGLALAYVKSETGGRQVWIEDLASGQSRRLTAGACNNDSPAWAIDSHSIVFSSDCDRGLGQSALYRLPARR